MENVLGHYISILKTPSNSIHGEFFCFNRSIVFRGDNYCTRQISSKSILYIFLCSNNHHEDSIQIFTTQWKMYLFQFPNFLNSSIVDTIKLMSLHSNCSIQSFSSIQGLIKSNVTMLWKNHLISTFRYLIFLNLFSGRSFLDPTNYPVFPVIILSFNEINFELNNSHYRDLIKNLNYLDQSRLIKIKSEKKKQNLYGGFLFSSSYSNFQIVSKYLASIYPYCTNIQPFSSVGDIINFHQNLSESFAELVPEYFYAVPIFSRTILPNWIESPADFISRHLRALESSFVSESLDSWIDLIWGIKQSGSSSIIFDNSYNPNLYSTVWSMPLALSNDYEVIENDLSTRGQIPHQLFVGKHPKRIHSSEEKSTKISLLTRYSSPIHFLSCIGNSVDQLRIFVALYSNELHCHRVSQTSFQIKVPHQSLFESISSKLNLVRFFESTDCSFVSINFRSCIPTFFDGIKRCLMTPTYSPHLKSICAACTCNDYAITGSFDGSVALWKPNQSSIICISVTYDHFSQIVSLSTNKHIGIVVAVSKMNSLTVSLLPSLKLIASSQFETQIGEFVFQSEIIEYPALIVLFLKNKDIYSGKTFSLTCNLQTEKTFPFGIIDTCHVYDSEGFSKIGLLTQKHQLLLIEPSTLENIQIIFTYTTLMTHLVYNPEIQQFVVSTEDHLLIIIPKNLNQKSK